MSYYTTIKTVSENGKPIKTEVSCAGKSRGFTDPNTGEISFDLPSNGSYTVYAKRMGVTVSSKIYGGKSVTLRLR